MKKLPKGYKQLEYVETGEPEVYYLSGFKTIFEAQAVQTSFTTSIHISNKHIQFLLWLILQSMIMRYVFLQKH